MAQHVSPEHHPAFEEYCETIFELAEDGLKVIQARIAERLEVSRPAVSGMVTKMAADGLVVVDGSEIGLTKKGLKLAKTMVRRHRIAERFLTDVLDLSWAQAHHEAGKWEHVISPSVEAAMVKHLDNPTTCPHGNPIPGSGYVDASLEPLANAQAGSKFIVQRITEELEFQPGALEFLEKTGLVPGTTVAVAEDQKTKKLAIKVGGRTAALDNFTAERILGNRLS